MSVDEPVGLARLVVAADQAAVHLLRPQPSRRHRETVVAMGNRLVGWASLAALPALALDGLRRSRSDAAIVAVVGFGATYLPLLLLSRVRAATFLYYMLPSVPFMGLAIATVLVGWLRSSIGRWIALTYAVAVVGMFVFFLPVLVASPLSQHELDARQWFRDCRPAPGMAAPEGWCWR